MSAKTYLLRLCGLLAMALLSLLPLRCAAAGMQRVVLVISESSQPYLDFVTAYGNRLAVGAPDAVLQVMDLAQFRQQPPERADLLVSAGSPAAELLADQSHSPLLMSLITRASHARLGGNKAGGVFIDQPPARYAALVRAALPTYSRVGLLVGRDSIQTAAQLGNAARSRGLQVLSVRVGDEAEIHAGLREILEQPAVLMALPDNTVFNARTLPSLLLASFRARAPVVGFSPAYTGAGAVVALYSTPQQLALQSADISIGVLRGGAMPAAQYPQHYTIGVNERVARSLGLNLDDEAAIRARLEKLERQP